MKTPEIIGSISFLGSKKNHKFYTKDFIMCSNNIQYSANNGSVTISTANSNLDGTGSLGTVLTATQDGTLVKSIIIKATGNTTLGMVRLFIDNGGGTIVLLQEIMIPANNQTAVVQAYSTTINSAFVLQNGFLLKASTQNAEGFNIVAVATNWDNCDC